MHSRRHYLTLHSAVTVSSSKSFRSPPISPCSLPKWPWKQSFFSFTSFLPPSHPQHNIISFLSILSPPSSSLLRHSRSTNASFQGSRV
jgi:hypothetical protein